jgi:hypothetical protein
MQNKYSLVGETVESARPYCGTKERVTEGGRIDSARITRRAYLVANSDRRNDENGSGAGPGNQLLTSGDLSREEFGPRTGPGREGDELA